MAKKLLILSALLATVASCNSNVFLTTKDSLKSIFVSTEECLKLYANNLIDADGDGVVDMCDSKGVWVSADEGDDAYGNGTWQKPFKTIETALKHMQGKKNKLYIAEGHYAESVIVGPGIRIKGGYSLLKDGQRSFDPKSFETILSPADHGSFAIQFGPGKKKNSSISSIVLGARWKEVPTLIDVVDSSPVISENTLVIGGGAKTYVGIAVKGDSQPIIENNDIRIFGASPQVHSIGIEAVALNPKQKLRLVLKNNRITIESSDGLAAGVIIRKENNDSHVALEMDSNTISCSIKACFPRFLYGVLLGQSAYGSIFSFDEAIVNRNSFSLEDKTELGKYVAIQANNGRLYLSNNIIVDAARRSAAIAVDDAILEMDFNTIISEKSALTASGKSLLTLKNNILTSSYGPSIILADKDSSIGSIVNTMLMRQNMDCAINGAQCKESDLSLNAEGYISSAKSAAIDAGECLPKTITLIDIKGTKRPQGKACDIGAHEYTPDAPRIADSP
ncbi:MAG: choice-of-anchor Q domain-containing protein [Pseudomonadota bacterium]